MERWDLDESQLVAATARVGEQLEASLRRAVARARESGVSWEQIATALGTARQSAWRRFKEGDVTHGTQEKTKETLRTCSFCGLPQDEVEHLVAAPTGANICAECLDIAQEMLTSARAGGKAGRRVL